MACMKCGRDTQAGQVFCSSCLEVMKEYPVKPGIAVQIPVRRTPPPVRKPAKRKTPSPEEQIRILRQRVWLLMLCLLSALLIAVLLAFPAYEHLFNEDLLPGQNYSTKPLTTGNVATGSAATGNTAAGNVTTEPG